MPEWRILDNPGALPSPDASIYKWYRDKLRAGEIATKEYCVNWEKPIDNNDSNNRSYYRFI